MQEISSYIRFEKMQNLFFKNQINQPISISISIRENLNPVRNSLLQNILITMGGDYCKVIHREGKDPEEIKKQSGGEEISELNFSGMVRNEKRAIHEFGNIYFYRFVVLFQFPDPSNAPLKSPYGQNLFSVVMYDKKCLEIMKNLFSSSEFKFVLNLVKTSLNFNRKRIILFISIHISFHQIHSDMLRFSLLLSPHKKMPCSYLKSQNHIHSPIIQNIWQNKLVKICQTSFS
jgi:hypothetical protein|nr:hypothetical protein [Methanospirillum sp.]